MALFRDKEAINQEARTYLLKMETIGYLPIEELERMRNSLESCGLEDVDFSGTSIEEMVIGIPFLVSKQKTLEIPIKIRLRSTAKHG